jgi:transposase-like protein
VVSVFHCTVYAPALILTRSRNSLPRSQNTSWRCAVDDLSRSCCLNSRCPDHGVRGGENLSVCGRYGKATPIRFLRCRSCGDRFSERKGTPLFRSPLPREKAMAVLEHVADGCGVRQTERLVGVHRDTVTRYTREAGDHAVAAHDELVASSPPHDRGPVR